MGKPTLSVVMPNYNHALYVGAALEAIAAQSWQPDEIIVVDDGSNDESVDVIESFARRETRVRLLKNSRNMGAVASASRALQAASGDYVYGAAADDRVLPGLFEKAMGLLAEYPMAGLCCSDWASFDDISGACYLAPQYVARDAACLTPRHIIDRMRWRPFQIAGHTAIVKRSALLEAGGFIRELRWHCDWFAFLVVGFRHGICYVPEVLALARGLSGSYSAAGRREKRVQNEILRHMLDLLGSPLYGDVREAFVRTGVLTAFRREIFAAVAESPRHWKLNTLLLIRRAMRDRMLDVFPCQVREALKRWDARRVSEGTCAASHDTPLLEPE